MSRIISIEAFGFRDVVCATDKNVERSNDFSPATVVFYPKRKPLYGAFASNSSVDSGVGFSKDSQIVNSFIQGNLDENAKNCRRVLISLLWRKMILTKKSEPLFKSNYSCARLIAGYINELVNAFVAHNGAIENDDEFILAIPNEMDQYAQEYLLRELRNYTKNHLDNVTLVWRPIASVLFYLNKDDKSQLFFLRNSKVGVVYVGPDSIENSVYDFEFDYKFNKYVPVRRKNSSYPVRFTGMDVVASLIKYDFNQSNIWLKKEWSLENTAIDYWERICCTDNCYVQKKIPFCTENGWKLRNIASHTPFDKIIISKFNSGAYLIGDNPKEANYTVNEAFTHMKFDDLHLDTIILCGPMASLEIARFIAEDFNFKVSSDFEKNSVCFNQYDDIACGAYLYKSLLNRKLPTYYDELDPLELCYVDKAEWKYENIIKKGKLVKGGQKETIHLNQLFSVKKGSNCAEIYMAQSVSSSDSYFPDDQSDREFRFGKAEFKNIAKQDVTLRLEILSQAVSGLAKVYFYSVNSDYLPKDGWEFDYSKMENKDSLPELKLGAPREEKRLLTGNDYAIRFFKRVRLITSNDYLSIINDAIKFRELNNYLNKFNDRRKNDNTFCIGFDGKSNSDERTLLISYLSDLVGRIIKYYDLSHSPARNRYEENKEKLLRSVSYLYKSMPNNCKEFYQRWFDSIEQKRMKNDKSFFHDFFEPMCRFCFVAPDNIDRIVKFVEDADIEFLKRNYFYKGIGLLFNYSSDARIKMTGKFASKLVSLSLSILKEEHKKIIEQHKKKSIEIKHTVVVNASFLLLMSLKYRDKDPGFLITKNSMENKEKVDSYLKLTDEIADFLLKNAYLSTRAESNAKKLKDIRKGVLDFINGEGNQNIISMISSEANSDSDSEENDENE